MNVLIGCECSGEVQNAFRAKGHNAWSCDLQPSDDESTFHLKMDVLIAIMTTNWDLLIAHPPCTHLAVSGARWFDDPRFPLKRSQQSQAIKFFLALYNCHIPKVCIENPVGIMSTVFRKPDQIIQPWWFGHGEKKATCLWLRGLPKLIKKQYIPWEEHNLGNIENLFLTVSNKTELAKLRSKTYHGVALAMADQWGQ